MPSYTLPKIKKSKNTHHTETSVANDPWMRRINGIPADKKILKSLVIGEEVEVLMKAKVIEVADVTHFEGDDRRSFDLELISYEVYDSDDNEFTDLSKDED